MSRMFLGAMALITAVALVGYRTWSKLNIPGEPDDRNWGMCDFRTWSIIRRWPFSKAGIRTTLSPT